MVDVLKVEGLSFAYAGEPVWEDVSFSLDQGQIAFLTGANGSGKSTLLKCLAGWLRPSSGEVEVFPVGKRAAFTFVSDVPAFYDDLTAGEHVDLLLRAGKMRGRAPYVRGLLESFGLGAALGRYPASFSRGMRQKLALALALVARPGLLLLDEPYAPLDGDSSAVFDRELEAAAADGAAVLASCHARTSGLVPAKTLHLRDGKLGYG